MVNFRVFLQKRLKDSPGLKAKLPEIYNEILADSSKSMSKLFELSEEANLSLTQVLDDDWFPDKYHI